MTVALIISIFLNIALGIFVFYYRNNLKSVNNDIDRVFKIIDKDLEGIEDQIREIYNDKREKIDKKFINEKLNKIESVKTKVFSKINSVLEDIKSKIL